jgi:response regulator RpfG family c-di-GMP phosphodiesterase
MPLTIFYMAGVGNVDVFGQVPGRSDAILLWDRKYRFGEEDVAKLRAREHRAVYVTRVDALQVSQQLRQSWDSIVHDCSYAPCDRFALLQIAAAPELDATFRLLQSARYIELAQRVGSDLATVLSEGGGTAFELYCAVQRGGSPGLRATNLAGYATILAGLSGVQQVAELQQIAVGAMLHDIGARMLPPEMTANPGRLSPNDRATLENHPRQSYEELLPHKTFSRGQLMMAYQHHEHMDGRGYPVAILREEIHPWARLLSIVDAFDGLTNGQRGSCDLAEALAQLEQEAGTQFDSELLACWSSSLRSA